MPFVSQAQRRACWAKYNKDIKEGRTPAWDCKEWEKYTAKMNGPLLELLEEKKSWKQMSLEIIRTLMIYVG